MSDRPRNIGGERMISLPDGSTHVLASPGSRLGARVIDVIIWAVIAFIIAITYRGVASSDDGLVFDSTSYYWIAISFGFGLAYEVTLTALRGQTLGKQALRIKVISVADSDVPGWAGSFKRWIIPAVAGLLPIVGLVGLIGYLALLWDKSRQTWWDKVAATVVVKP